MGFPGDPNGKEPTNEKETPRTRVRGIQRDVLSSLNGVG